MDLQDKVAHARAAQEVLGQVARVRVDPLVFRQPDHDRVVPHSNVQAARLDLHPAVIVVLATDDRPISNVVISSTCREIVTLVGAVQSWIADKNGLALRGLEVPVKAIESQNAATAHRSGGKSRSRIAARGATTVGTLLAIESQNAATAYRIGDRSRSRIAESGSTTAETLSAIKPVGVTFSRTNGEGDTLTQPTTDGHTRPRRPANYWRRRGTWTGVTGWIGASWAEPMVYDYGNNLTYENGDVYQDGEQVASAEEYAQQAQQIAETPVDVDPEQAEWMPLGTFAMVREKDTEPIMYLQLAVSKEGIITGTYSNTTSNSVQPVEGHVDQESQRAAWWIGDKRDNILETGIYNLTQDQTPLLVHFGRPANTDVAAGATGRPKRRTQCRRLTRNAPIAVSKRTSLSCGGVKARRQKQDFRKRGGEIARRTETDLTTDWLDSEASRKTFVLLANSTTP